MPTYNHPIKSKQPNLGTTIFTVMSALAKEHNAINLSQGFPNFPCSPELISLVNQYMVKGYNQYPPMAGVQKLRDVLAAKTEKLYGTPINPDSEITVTAGATQAIYTIITALVHPEDEVIMFTPAYDCYAPTIQLAGGKPIYLSLKTPNYTIDWQEVKQTITSKTRMIIINTPHNPTGTVLTPADMQALQDVVRGTDIVILSDEVYEHITFDGVPHESVMKYPELAQRSFAIYSFGKTFHATGWKMGYCIGPKELMVEFRKVHQFVVFTCNTAIQYALAGYLENENNYLELGSFYQKKRDYFNKLIQGSRFNLIKSKGTYFELLNYSNITDEKDTEYACRLIKENGLASIPISVFYHNNEDNKVLRFCFAKTNETLEQAAEVIRSI
jgi:methionine aminotransferase